MMRWASWLCVAAALAGCDRVFGLTQLEIVDARAPGDWAQISAGRAHTCGIKLDGTLWCWGRNVDGEVGVASPHLEIATPQQVDGSTWSFIAATRRHTCGLHTDGSLFCWGSNLSGEVAAPGGGPVTAPQNITGSWIEVATGEDHTCAIKSDNSLWCWGANTEGQLGVVTGTGDMSMHQVPASWLHVAAGSNHTCGIQMDNALYCWGAGDNGELGTGAAIKVDPMPLPVGDAYAKIVAGDGSTCALRSDGRLRCWGSNVAGGLGDSTTSDRNVPVAVGNDATDWVDVVAGYEHVCGRRADGSLWCWGDNSHGQLATPAVGALSSMPTPIDGGPTWLTAGLGEFHTCAITTDHNLYCAGGDGFSQLGDAPAHRTPTQVPGSWHQITARERETCAVDDGGMLWCWGSNDFGELGDGTTEPRDAPVAIAANTVAVAVGNETTCQLEAGGMLWCWGNNLEGELGIGMREPSATIPQLQGDATWASIDLSSHGCALDATGAMSCWGTGTSGELGEGDPGLTDVFTPESVGGPFTAVGTGDQSTCVIANQQVSCWGFDADGELGDGATANHLNPTPVSFPTSVAAAQLAVGPNHACAIDGTGNAWCWGANFDDEIDGSATPALTGRAMPGMWSRLAAGGTHTCGVQLDHSLWCWGNDLRGQLGDGGDAQAVAMTRVGTDADWDEVTSGGAHTCATKLTSHALYCWGEDEDGELGDAAGWRGDLQRVP